MQKWADYLDTLAEDVS